jgi:hypothetical protein
MSINDSGLISPWGDEVSGNDARTGLRRRRRLILTASPMWCFRTRFLELRFSGWVPFALSIGFRRFYFHVSRGASTVPDSPRWKLICHRQSAS